MTALLHLLPAFILGGTVGVAGYLGLLFLDWRESRKPFALRMPLNPPTETICQNSHLFQAIKLRRTIRAAQMQRRFLRTVFLLSVFSR